MTDHSRICDLPQLDAAQASTKEGFLAFLRGRAIVPLGSYANPGKSSNSHHGYDVLDLPLLEDLALNLGAILTPRSVRFTLRVPLDYNAHGSVYLDVARTGQERFMFHPHEARRIVHVSHNYGATDLGVDPTAFDVCLAMGENPLYLVRRRAPDVFDDDVDGDLFAA